MKAINVTKLKTVNYHGVEVMIPVHIKFIAADKSGLALGFVDLPVPIERLDWWDASTGSDMYEVGTFDLEGMDWKDSLQSV